MIMSSPRPVRYRTDRPEIIPPVGSSEKSPVTLEVGIALLPSRCSLGVNITTFCVGFPKLDDNTGGRGAILIEYLPVEVSDLPD